MKPYSVLLAYPYDQYEGEEPDTYFAWVMGRNPAEAIVEARREAVAAQADGMYLLHEFSVLAVFDGHHELLHGTG